MSVYKIKYIAIYASVTVLRTIMCEEVYDHKLIWNMEKQLFISISIIFVPLSCCIITRIQSSHITYLYEQLWAVIIIKRYDIL